MKTNKWLMALTVVMVLAIAPAAIAAPNLSNQAAGRTGTTVVNTILSGSGVPGKTIGIDGDFYIDTKNANLYGPKTNGVWKLTTSLRPLPTKSSPTLPGATGSTGATGTAGASGLVGPRGLPGATGEKGATGATGSNGLPGAAGTNGLPGTAGAPGTPGTAGAPGAPGTNGAAGSSNAYFVDIGNWSLRASSALGKSDSSIFGNLSAGSYTFEIMIDGTFAPNSFDLVTIGMQLSASGGSLDYRTFASDTKAQINGVTNRHIGFIMIGRIICTELTTLHLTAIHVEGLGPTDSLNFSGRALINQVGAIG
jgi:hypothetical protein